MDDLDVDPGWSAKTPSDGLSILRRLWVAFTAAVLLFALVLRSVVEEQPDSVVFPWLLGLLLIALFSQIAVRQALARPLPCDGLSALASGFRTRFFLATAFAETPALAAFVGSFVVGRWWLYWVILPFTLAAFWRNAPTPGHLQAEQDKLRDRGCTLSLVRALRTPTATP